MPNFKSFEFRIALLSAVILITVSVTGVLAYLQLNATIGLANEDTSPNEILFGSEKLLSRLTDCENAVKSFGITKDSAYLVEFEYQKIQAEAKLKSLLKELNKQDTLYKNLDSLKPYVQQKFNLLDEYLILQDPFRAEQALNKVLLEIKKASKGLEESTIEKPEEKSIFKRIFGRKKKSKKELEEELAQNKVTIAEVNTEVQEVQNEERYIEQLIRENELMLILEDNALNQKIKSVLEPIKANQIALAEKRAIEFGLKTQETNRLILIFCFAIGILIIITSGILAIYLKNNLAYKKAMREAKNEAEELAKAKERFLANMSHEIRTPMNAIVGFTEQLNQEKLNKQQAEYVDIIAKSADHIIYLVNDVLEFSKLQNGKVNLESRPFNINTLAHEMIDLMRSQAKAKNIELLSHFSKGIPASLVGDSFRLKQIIINLLSNAIKFTNKGKVELNIVSNQLNEQECILNFEIIDTGIGMSAEESAKVFQEFEQANAGTSRDFGGTGLGLSICQMLVELHGGSIKIESEKNKGTAVQFSIKYAIAKTQVEKSGIQEKPTKYSLEKIKILIADDEVYNRNLIKTILKKYQCSFQEVENGKEVLDALKKEHFDILLMDIRMPLMDGMETISNIRKDNSAFNKLPTIAITAAVSKEDKLVYQHAGFNACLQKPFKEKDLLGCIQQILSIDSTTNSIPDENEDQHSNQIDFSNLIEDANGDDAFVVEMIEILIESTNEAFDRIEKAIEEKDYKIIAEQAHKVLSPLNHIKAYKLYQQLKDLETLARENSKQTFEKEVWNSIVAEKSNVFLEVEKKLKQLKKA